MEKKVYEIAVIVKAVNSDFWQTILSGAKAAMRDHEYIHVKTYGPPEESDVKEQVEILERIVDEHPDGIVIASTSNDLTVPAIERAMAAGIPVVTLDNQVSTDKYFAFMGTDSVKAVSYTHLDVYKRQHPDSNVWKLDLGQRQHVEILKVLMGKNTRILIFDEPTSVLAPHEIQAFLEMLVQLKRDNYAVLLITHKIKEIIAVADLITVLRQGKQVQTFTREEGYSEQKIVASMLNSEDTDLNLEYRRYEQLKNKPEGGEVFRASHLTVKDNHNRNIIDDAQFGLRRGEILGVAGISGRCV